MRSMRSIAHHDPPLHDGFTHTQPRSSFAAFFNTPAPTDQTIHTQPRNSFAAVFIFATFYIRSTNPWKLLADERIDHTRATDTGASRDDTGVRLDHAPDDRCLTPAR